MTKRREGDQRLRELKAAVLTRVAARVLTTKRTGLDGIAKVLLLRRGKGSTELDPELAHREDWDRPVD